MRTSSSDENLGVNKRYHTFATVHFSPEKCGRGPFQTESLSSRDVPPHRDRPTIAPRHGFVRDVLNIISVSELVYLGLTTTQSVTIAMGTKKRKEEVEEKRTKQKMSHRDFLGRCNFPA